MALRTANSGRGANRMRGKAKVYRGGSFKAVAKKIAAKQGVSLERASAILAAGTRRASVQARRTNPKLNLVK